MANDTYEFEEDGVRRIVHATRQVENHPPSKVNPNRVRGRTDLLIGKITAAGAAAGLYKVLQVAWDGAAWATVASGLVWDGGANLPEVYEINGLEGIAVDSIIFPYLVGASDGSFQWVFEAGGDGRTKVSANDTTPGYLLDKLVVDASAWLVLTEINDGGDEDLKITHIGPVNGSVDTIGSAAEGAEAAEGTTYDGTSSANGLDFYVMSRTAYYDAGDEILYGYIRKLTFDARGHFQALGAETRISIDVPVVC